MDDSFCENELLITASKEAISDFITATTIDGRLSFAKLVPEEQMEIRFCDPDTCDFQNACLEGAEIHCGYRWRIKHWGTTHDAFFSIVELNSKSKFAYISFDTMRDPPIAWLEAVAKEYQHIEFRLYYKTTHRRGSVVARNGLTAILED